MTITRFQSLIWTIANQMHVRTFLWLDHPGPAKRMAFTAKPEIAITSHLGKQLIADGFRWERGMWIVNREEECPIKTQP